ncbi:LOW QUALITY PROTEIN: guanylate-binding protein 1-like, partial [Aegotheles albertisi]
MASKVHMLVPICLIENTQTKGLVVQQEALQMLSEITQPVVVVAIMGPHHTGKSYLTNRLAGQWTGFSLGSSVQSHTKGIWMWCVPHPRQPGQTLVLLETEELGDVEKGDTRNNTWIFVLTFLLSSTLIYNSKGTIDQQTMEQLHYVTKLTEHVKLKAAPKKSEDELKDSEKFVLFLLTFVWAVRDFTLQLEVDGKEISEDESLEHALKLKAGSSTETQRYNEPWKCIHQFFPHHKGFVFDQPASKSDLLHLEELQDDKIDPEFQQVKKLCSHVWEKCPPKTIPGGHIMTGNLLGNLAVTYVETIWSGAVPCLESAVLALARTQNAAAVTESVTLYWDLMEQQVKLLTETIEDLLELHAQCEQEALELFMSWAFKDDICSFQAELRCKGALRDLFQYMEKLISDGVYHVSGGYKLFKGDQQALVQKCWELPGKGVEADVVLQEFLQSRETMAKSILKADLSLMEKDKKMKSNFWAGEMPLPLIKTLKDFYEKQLEEQQEMISHKREEESALLKEGCHDKANHLHDKTNKLEEEHDTIRNKYVDWIYSVAPTVFK